MLWAPGFIQMSLHLTDFASNCFEFQDLKQRGFRWQEVKLCVCTVAGSAASSECLWFPGGVPSPREACGKWEAGLTTVQPGLAQATEDCPQIPIAGPLCFASPFSLPCQTGFSLYIWAPFCDGLMMATLWSFLRAHAWLPDVHGLFLPGFCSSPLLFLLL